MSESSCTILYDDRDNDSDNDEDNDYVWNSISSIDGLSFAAIVLQARSLILTGLTVMTHDDHRLDDEAQLVTAFNLCHIYLILIYNQMTEPTE